MRKFIIFLLMIATIGLWGCANGDVTTDPSFTSEPTMNIVTQPTITPTEPIPTIPTEPPIELPVFTFEQENFEYIKFNNLKDLQAERGRLEHYTLEFILACTQYILDLPMASDDPKAQEAWEFYSTILVTEQNRLTELAEQYRWDYRSLEYPVATQVWLYMKNEFGWNDIVCAGIMGNLMAECGGCWTHDLDWQVNTSNGLGMIQWIGNRKKEIIAKYGEAPSVEEQLLFMYDELYGLNGVTKQVTNTQLNLIMDATTPGDCAFAFASYYERCHEQYREVRRDYANHAYQYFATNAYDKSAEA